VSNSARDYPERPIVGVGAVILVDAASPVSGLPTSLPEPYGIVLVKRRFEPLAGHWSLPGGMLEVGETLEAGVAREVLEETGLLVKVGVVIEVFDRIILDDAQNARPEGRAYGTVRARPADTAVGPTFRSGAQRVRYHYVLIDYLCRPTGGALQAGSDVSDASIADPRALAAYGVTSIVETVVSRALEIASAPALINTNEHRA
jgi:8-oxo-dGTP diphosphatase